MAYMNTGVLQMQKEDLEKAYEAFDILAQREPTNANAFFYRAQVSYLKGEYAAAKTDLENSLTLKSDDKDVIDLLAEVNKELSSEK